ncbi:MAG: ABC transporter substrate-binding protein, partial [Candidatus Promineifilaceae bacterium]
SFLKDTTELERPVFVGRESELDQLAELLDPALRDQAAIAFVVGDAGSGKTALINAFADMAQQREADLLVAVGKCNAFTGRGDPYLPFRSAMRMLTGDVESRWVGGTVTRNQAVNLWTGLPLAARALVVHGKDLLDTFVSSDSLISRVSAAVPDDLTLLQRLRVAGEQGKDAAGDIDQPELFEQYCDVLREIASERPILLLLDDLQWADNGSIDLLFHLSRGIAGTRVSVVGAYRPEEVALGRGEERHPLEPVIEEIKREYGDVRIDLSGTEGKVFVNEFIDTEPNRLDDEFRRLLFSHTGGQALFTLELLRDLQERGDLIQDMDGYWVASKTMEWKAMPARVEGVIEARIGRLKDELRDILTVASVEGEDFTAQVVARVQQLQERQLLRTLSRELEKRHQLIHERPSLQVGERHLSRYRFRHSLFQRYLYDDLGIGERRILHGEIAAILEELYAGRLEEITFQLASHYTEAGDGQKAANYLIKAGDQARTQYAYQEAINHYRRALPFLEEQDDHDLSARTQMKLGLTYHSAFQFREAQEAYEGGFALWQQASVIAPASIAPAAPHALRIGWTQVRELDPAISNDSAALAVVGNLFSGLVKFTASMDVVPDMAHRWEVMDGGRKYVFHLRRDVCWSDETPITAADCEFAWRRILDPGIGSPHAGLLSIIKGARALNEGDSTDPTAVGIQAIDEHSLSFELERPAGYFLQLLAHDGICPLPRHVVTRYGQEWTRPENISTYGPFLLKAFSPEEGIVLSRNPSYHDPFGGNVRQVTISMIDHWSDRLAMYQDDMLDVVELYDITPREHDQIKKRYAGEYLLPHELSVGYVGFDSSRPPFDDARVRQAFVHAIDRQELANSVMRGNVSAATDGFVPPGMPGHSSGIGLPYDPERARRLMREAGYAQDKLEEPISTFPHVDLFSPEAESVAETSAYLVKSWRENLGLDLSVQSFEWANYMDAMLENRPHFYVSAWVADYPDPHSFLKVAVRASATIGWQHDAYDRLLEKAEQVADQGERMRLYSQADRILIEEAAVMPLTYWRRPMLIKPWVRKYHIPSFGNLQWKDVVIDAH